MNTEQREALWERLEAAKEAVRRSLMLVDPTDHDGIFDALSLLNLMFYGEWQMVPVEPTAEMLNAGDAEYAKGCADPTVHTWDVMLAAAPNPLEE